MASLTDHRGETLAGTPAISLRTLRGDLAGGATSAVISLPISMTIGVAAFAPLGEDYVVYGVLAGIYGAIILGLAPFFVGGRSRLVSGPRATSALILASLVTQLLSSDALSFPPGHTAEHVVAIAFFTMFLAGLFQFAGGITGIGDLVRHIPQPVIAGFVNSAALFMIMGQSWILLGIPRQENFMQLFLHLDEIRPVTVLPGLAAGAAMLAAARWIRRLPGALAGLVVGTAIYYAIGYVTPGIDVGPVLGVVPSRFPTPEAANMASGVWSAGNVVAVLAFVVPAALAMAVLASFETLFAQSTLDDLSETRSDPNRELAWSGSGNMAAALLGGLVGSGGMIRTRPGYEAGGRTPLMGVFVSLFLLASIVLFTDLIQYIPRAVIAGMILVLALQIFDGWSLSLLKRIAVRGPGRRASIADALIVVLVVVVAMTFDLVAAVGAGTVLAGAVFVSRMSGSLVRRVYRGPAIHSRSYWDEKRQEALNRHGHTIAVLELDGPIFFGTADSLDQTIHRLQLEGVTRVVLDMKRVRDIDSTGTRAIARIKRRLENRGGVLVLSYVPRRLRDDGANAGYAHRFSARNPKSELVDVVGEKRIYPDTDQALAFCEGNLIDQTLSDAAWGRAAMSGRGAIFHGFGFREIRLIRRLSVCCPVLRGETVFQQWDKGNGLYYVARGRLDIFVRMDERGEKKRLQTVLPGGVFGEMALLDDGSRAASVVAATDSLCYRLDSAAFEELKETRPDIAIKLLINICNSFSIRLRSANAMISELEN